MFTHTQTYLLTYLLTASPYIPCRTLAASTYTFGTTGLTSDQPIARPVPTQDRTIQKRYVTTTIPWAGFESTITVSQQSRPTPRTERTCDPLTDTHRSIILQGHNVTWYRFKASLLNMAKVLHYLSKNKYTYSMENSLKTETFQTPWDSFVSKCYCKGTCKYSWL